MLIKFNDDLIFSEWKTKTYNGKNYYCDYFKYVNCISISDYLRFYEYEPNFYKLNWQGNRHTNLLKCLFNEYIEIYGDEIFPKEELDKNKEQLDNFLIKMSKMKAFI